MKSGKSDDTKTYKDQETAQKQQQNIRQIFKDVCQGKQTHICKPKKKRKQRRKTMAGESGGAQKISKSRRSKTAKENATCLMATHTHTHTNALKRRCEKQV